MPATNVTSERSFSALRRVKSYLQNTMSQQRLNNLMLLHVHKGITDAINLKAIASEFIGDSEHRLKLNFTENPINKVFKGVDFKKFLGGHAPRPP